MKRLDPATLPLTGKVVIEASAGTGKTYTITSIYLRLVLEKRLPPKEILVVTFTRAATAELRERIRQRLLDALAHVERCDAGLTEATDTRDDLLALLLATARDDGGFDTTKRTLLSALDELDEAPVFTIHGFCQRVLADHAIESGAEVGTDVVADASPYLEEIADDFAIRELANGSEGRAALLSTEHRKLLGLAHLALASRGMRVLPQVGDSPSLDLEPFRQAQRACRELFARDKAELRTALKRVAPIARFVDDWLPRIARALETPYPPIFHDEAATLSVTRSGLDKKVASAKKGTPRPEHAFFDAMEALLEAETALLGDAERARIAFRRAFVDEASDELSRRTRERAKSTFDALLARVYDALNGAHGEHLARTLTGQHRIALLDEFQDTDPLQYAIFHRLFGNAPQALFMIGDPKQAIYAFRGADVLAYMRAREDAGENVFTLDVNYRSDPCLLLALNATYGGSLLPFVRSDIAYVDVTAPPTHGDRLRCAANDPRRALDFVLFDADDDDALIARVASDIVATLNSGTMRQVDTTERALRPTDIAVLCRTNAEASAVAHALAQRAVPTQLSATESVFDSEEARELERLLAALVQPTDLRLLRAFLASSWVGADAAELVALDENDARFATHRARILEGHTLLHARGPLRALTTTLTAYDTEQRLLTRSDGLRRVLNLQHLTELLADGSTRLKLGPASLLRLFRRALLSVESRALFGADAHFLRPLEHVDAVTLVTVHKSKGLEYPLVIAPFFSAARTAANDMVTFHDPDADDALTLVLGGSDLERARPLRAEEELAENARLLYVALTRAKHRVSVVVARARTLSRSPLVCLLGGRPPEPDSDASNAFSAIAAQCMQLSTQHPQAISARALPQATDDKYMHADVAPRTLVSRAVTRSFGHEAWVGSFSALLRRTQNTLDDALDHDTLPVEIAPPVAASGELPLALAAFPRGASAGQLIHEIIEVSDFAAPAATLRETLREFERVGRMRAHEADALATALERVFACPLPEANVALRDIPLEKRLNELEFLLPVPGGFDPYGLARAFVPAHLPAFAAAYSDRLRELDFAKLTGFLRGFIDLVFEHDGRYYLADYKSNDLGPRAADYGPERLYEPMLGHHYVLQYHLYALALHRHLARRVPRYDYERHFGGVLYLFLRGMSPELKAHNGVFFDRPQAAMIANLDVLFGEPTETRDG